MNLLEPGSIIAAIRTQEEFDAALKSDVTTIFDLSPDLLTIKKRLDRAHESGKQMLIHLDLASGLGKDKSGMVYVRHIGVDGIISTRANLIRTAHELGMFTVQRFFAVDSHSVETALETLKGSKADMIEIMPGIALSPIRRLCRMQQIPVIAGGLIDDEDAASAAFDAGATAISTGKQSLWNKA
ncbi:MAG: glycerol-3-phosphate responsive antiterminator [Ruminococcaceae bacterium]|nr:glycerol-3-phosphate responsive antiterminator [Oscillospiraceae bacterium]